MGWNTDPGSQNIYYNEYTVPGDFNSISAAMDAATFGDKVFVFPDYQSSGSETFPIIMKDGVILTGTAFEEPLDLNRISQTVIEGDGSGDVLQFEGTSDRTVVMGLTIRNGHTGITMEDACGILYANIITGNNYGLDVSFSESMGFYSDNVILDHNTIVDGMQINYESAPLLRTEYSFPVKLDPGPVLTYNIFSVETNIDDIEWDIPIYISFEQNDFWPDELIGYYDDIGGCAEDNIQQNPDFVDESSEDYHLSTGSPCFLDHNYTSLIGAQYEELVPDFLADPVDGYSPLMVQYDNNSTKALFYEPIEYLWHFGDGDSSIVENPEYMYNEIGTYTVSLTMRDRYASETEIKENFITINEYINLPPVMAEISDYTIVEDSCLTIELSATDPDSHDLDYSAFCDIELILLDIENDTLTVTPVANWSGDVGISVIVGDGALTDTTSFELHVLPVNDHPILTLIGNQIMDEDSVLVLQLTAIDIDSDSLTFSAISNNVDVSVEVDSMNNLIITPAANWHGETTIIVTVDDHGLRLSDNQMFVLTVLSANDPPEIDSITDQEVFYNSLLSIPLSAIDIDDDPIFYTGECNIGDILMTIEEATLEVHGNDWSGTANCAVFAHDGNGGLDSTLFTLLIYPTTQAVTLTIDSLDLSNQTIDIWLNTTAEIAGFQFQITDVPDILSIVNTAGGISEQAGFLVSILNEQTIVGEYSGENSIMAGEFLLTTLTYTGFGTTEVCLVAPQIQGLNQINLPTEISGNCVEMIYAQGDPNYDGSIDVTDIVFIIGIIFNEIEPTDAELWAADVNGDGTVNIVDIVELIDIILGGRINRGRKIENGRITDSKGRIELWADGEISGVQIEFLGEFLIAESFLPDNWEIHNSGQTILIFGIDGSSFRDDKLFEYSGNFEIESVLISDWYGNAVKAEMIYAPQDYLLKPVYPNPFNPVTTIEYELPQRCLVNISIYNLQGQMMTVLVHESKEAGYHTVDWNGGQQPSGLYFVKMESSAKVQTQKMMLIK